MTKLPDRCLIVGVDLNLDPLAVRTVGIAAAVVGSIPGLCDDAVLEIKMRRPSVRWLSGPETHERANVVRPLLRLWLPGDINNGP